MSSSRSPIPCSARLAARPWCGSPGWRRPAAPTCSSSSNTAIPRPALTEGRGGAHRVEGIATGAVPPHLTRADYDEARAIDDEEARVTARRLAREEGVFAGTSTGLKYLAGDLFAPGLT